MFGGPFGGWGRRGDGGCEQTLRAFWLAGVGCFGLGFRVHGQGESSVACGLPSEKA